MLDGRRARTNQGRPGAGCRSHRRRTPAGLPESPAVRIAFVVNPNARAVTPASTERAVARWSAHHELTLVRTEPGRRTPGALIAALEGAEAVVVFGGDGTVNDVVNAMVTSGTDATLVPLPVGTTNVVARTLGLPADPAAAEVVALGALAAGRTRRRGIGWLNDAAFVANAGIGLDAAVVARTEAHAHRKQRWGHAWFVTAALRESAPRNGIRAIRLRRTSGAGPDRCHTVRHDEAATGARGEPRFPGGGEPAPGADEVAAGPGDQGHDADEGPDPTAFWVLALAAHPYTYLGRRPVELLAPDAAPGGALSVLWFAPMRYHRLLRLTARSVLSSGGITRAAEVGELAVGSCLELASGRPVVWQTDGEARPATADFVLRWQPDALRVVDPAPGGAAVPS